MKLDLLPDGRPTEHLGISHMLRHWCRPREQWEDLLLEPQPPFSAPEAMWPSQLWELLSAAGLEPETGPPWAGLRWESLRSSYRQGYGTVVLSLAASLPLPPQAPWARHPKGHWMTHAGHGVLLGVKHRRDGHQLHTAYRPADFKLRDYRCPPRDIQNVSLRRRIAEHRAAQRLAHLLHGGDDDS